MPLPSDAGSATALTLVASGSSMVDFMANTTASVSLNIFDLTAPLPQPDIGPMIRSATSSSTTFTVNQSIPPVRGRGGPEWAPAELLLGVYSFNHLPDTSVSRYYSAANLPVLRSATTNQLEMFVAFGRPRGNRSLMLSASCGPLERGL